MGGVFQIPWCYIFKTKHQYMYDTKLVSPREKSTDSSGPTCIVLYNCIKFISETKSIYIKYIQNVVKNTHINTLCEENTTYQNKKCDTCINK